MNIPFRKAENGIIIEIKVEPRSSKAAITGVMGSALKVKLTSAPVDGAANKQLIEILSKGLKVKKSSIKILRGETSKNKTVLIEGVDTLCIS